MTRCFVVQCPAVSCALAKVFLGVWISQNIIVFVATPKQSKPKYLETFFSANDAFIAH